MSTWAWVLVVAAASVVVVGLLATIVRRVHKLPAEQPLHGDPENIAAPVPLDVAFEADGMTQRELEAEAERSQDGRSRVPR